MVYTHKLTILCFGNCHLLVQLYFLRRRLSITIYLFYPGSLFVPPPPTHTDDMDHWIYEFLFFSLSLDFFHLLLLLENGFQRFWKQKVWENKSRFCSFSRYHHHPHQHFDKNNQFHFIWTKIGKKNSYSFFLFGNRNQNLKNTNNKFDARFFFLWLRFHTLDQPSKPTKSVKPNRNYLAFWFD